ncbi:hypothetical protein Tco_0571107 [Tanacetum coccineum]
MTQSSIVGSSWATTMLVNPEYAPLSSTNHCSRPQHESFQAGEYYKLHHQDQPIDKEAKYDNQILSDRVGSLFPMADVSFHVEKRNEISKEQLGKEGDDQITKCHCLLSIDPGDRGSATASLNSEPSELPKYPRSKELDVKLRDEEARRQIGLSGKSQVVDGNKKVRPRDRTGRAVPAPEANAEIQSN